MTAAPDASAGWRRGVLPALLGVGIFGATASLVQFTHGERLVEYERFGRGILGGAIPYRDFFIEYPPWSIPAFLLPAPGGSGYEERFRLWMWTLGAVSIILLTGIRAVAGSPRREIWAIAAFVGLTPLLFDPSPLFNGFDWWPAAQTLLALALLLAERRRAAAGVLGLATASKIYPAVLLPLMLLFGRRRSWQAAGAEVTTFVGVNLLVNVPFAILGFHNLVYCYSRLVRRPLQVESLFGSLLLAAHQVGMYRPTVYVSFGGSEDLAGRLPSVLAVASALLMGAAMVAVWVVFRRGPRDVESLLTAAAPCVAGFIAFGKVFSPEYQVWLIAIVPLVAAAARRPALALLGASLVLTQLYFPTSYLEVVQLHSIDWLVVARNVAVVALFAALFRELRRLSAAADYAGATADSPVVAVAS